MFALALEMKRLDVDGMLGEISAQDLQRWLAFFAVRHEKEAEASRNKAAGLDEEEVIHW